MDLIFEQIDVPEKRSFIARRLDLPLRSPKIHSHKNYELNFIVEGEGRRLVGDNIASFEANDLVLMGPHLPHCWDVEGCNGQEEPSCIVVHFDEDIIDSNFFSSPELRSMRDLFRRSSRGISFSGAEIKCVKPLLMQLSTSRGLDSYILLLQVFQCLLDTPTTQVLAETPYSASYKRELNRINQVYQYVLENIGAEVSQEKAAALIHMAPGSFCRYFRRKTDSTFSAYVKKVRMGLAAKMLIETDLRISQVSYDCGYNSISNFNHHFRLMFGKSPTQYRRDIKSMGGTVVN